MLFMIQKMMQVISNYFLQEDDTDDNEVDKNYDTDDNDYAIPGMLGGGGILDQDRRSLIIKKLFSYFWFCYNKNQILKSVCDGIEHSSLFEIG